MNNNPQINCVIYARVSTNHGLNQAFNSIDAQIESCQHYIAINVMQGWQCDEAHTFVDEALSGGSTERPALQKMLKLVKAGKIQVVLIYKIDRLSRNLRDFIDMQELFTAHGCSLASTTESFDTSTSMGRAMLNLVGVFAQLARERTRERILDKIAATKARGLWVGGVAPFGYEVKDSKLEIHKTNASLVKRVFNMRAAGITPQSIAKQLREEKLTYSSKRNGSKSWAARKVSTTLRCATYTGYIIHKDKLYEGIHQPIIERTLWQHIQTLIDQERSPEAKARQVRNDYPLRGLIICTQCGGKFTTSYTITKGVRHRYYLCATRHKHGKSVCNCPILSAKAVEEHLATELRELCEDKELEEALHSIIPEYSLTLISDCLHNIDVLLSRLNHTQLAELFNSVFEHIAFDPKDNAFLLTKRTEPQAIEEPV